MRLLTMVLGLFVAGTMTAQADQPATDSPAERGADSLTQSAYDWGDAPDAYLTLSPSGAFHSLLPGFYLGDGVDDEPNGQPSSLADGDDLDQDPLNLPPNFDDEDGVRFLSPLIPGFPAYVQVTAQSGGVLNAWVDFQLDGSWLETGDDILVDSHLVSGLNLLRFFVPPVLSSGYTSYARFRLSETPGTEPGGGAGAGEVEDLAVNIEPVLSGGSDFGDAPDPLYPTILANNGARHVLSPLLFLGVNIDPEPDGQADPNANGDDLDLDPFNPPLNVDDEDGVVFTSALVPGQTARAEVFVTAPVGPGYLWGWLDFLGDGWDVGDVIVAGVPVVQGTNSVQFLVPPTASTGPTYARFRLGSDPLIEIGGAAGSGEVEDYLVMIHPPETASMDFGDAPAPYPTLGSSNGASHQIFRTLYLGAGVDGEPDGQPDPSAWGDDTDVDVGNPLPNYDDEDGIEFHSPVVSEKAVLLTVRVGPTSGFLDAWIDYDINGSWEPDEHLFGGTSIWVQEGVSNLVFEAPPGIAVGKTFARFRLSTAGGLDPHGLAADGEVEDYEVTQTGDPLVFFDGFESGDTGDWSTTVP